MAYTNAQVGHMLFCFVLYLQSSSYPPFIVSSEDIPNAFIVHCAWFPVKDDNKHKVINKGFQHILSMVLIAANI